MADDNKIYSKMEITFNVQYILVTNKLIIIIIYSGEITNRNFNCLSSSIYDCKILIGTYYSLYYNGIEISVNNSMIYYLMYI